MAALSSGTDFNICFIIHVPIELPYVYGRYGRDLEGCGLGEEIESEYTPSSNQVRCMVIVVTAVS